MDARWWLLLGTWLVFLLVQNVWAIHTRRQDKKTGRKREGTIEFKREVGIPFYLAFFWVPGAVYFWGLMVYFAAHFALPQSAPALLGALAIPLQEPLLTAAAVLGGAVAVSSILLYVWGRVVMGDAWGFGNPQVKQGHHLVQRGPYRWVRHPLYAAGIANFVGSFLLFPHLLTLLPMLMIVGLYRLTMYEERLLETHFGERYTEYRAQAGRFLPRVGRA